MSDYRVILADDHTLFRSGVKRILEEVPGIQVMGEAADGLQLLTLLREMTPDLVILDISMPKMRGLEAIQEIKAAYPRVQVLILTMHKNAEYLSYALGAGAAGFLLKQDADPELLKAIATIRQGKTYLSPGISEVVPELLRRQKPNGTPRDVLSRREREVLKLLVEGKSSRQIGELLFISLRTVQNHRANIMKKLKVRGITDLIKYAVHKGYH
ncbi:MAG: response regulator transcription factor [Syntrophobacterales bacterium]|jgi:DNA-binding NarL/FixJ family response regulator